MKQADIFNDVYLITTIPFQQKKIISGMQNEHHKRYSPVYYFIMQSPVETYVPKNSKVLVLFILKNITGALNDLKRACLPGISYIHILKNTRLQRFLMNTRRNL